MSGDIKIQPVQIGKVPCLEIIPDIDRPSPLVFFSHGYESDKRDGIRLGYELASRGMICVSFDTIWRGERVDGTLDSDLQLKTEGIYPPDSGLEEILAFFQMVRQSGNDVKELAKHYQEDQRVDPERIGLAGYSMGGMVALFGAGFSPELSAVAAIAGIAGVVNFWNDILLQTRAELGKAADIASLESISKDWAKYLSDMDPYKKLLDYPERPLLLMGGDQDPVVQKKYLVDQYQYLAPHYQKYPDRIRLRLIEGIDHQFTAKMMIEVADWFAEVYL